MIQIIEADFSNNQQCNDYVRLLNDYACDVMGGGAELSPRVQQNICSEITMRDIVTVFIAYDTNQAIGLLTCMEVFSTFQCRAILNIHDVYVARDYRGQGNAIKLLQTAQQLALKQRCCKITLEVLQGNTVAKNAYLKFGFKGYELSPKMGSAQFWEKKLD